MTEPPFIRYNNIDRMHQTWPSKIACCHLLPHTYRLPVPNLWWCRSLCQKWGLFFVEPGVSVSWQY